MHVLVPVHWCSKIKEFQVGSNVPGIFSADDTIPHYFQSDKVGSLCSEFARVVYEVATDCDSDAVGVFFQWTVVYNNSSIGNGSVSWDELNALVVEKENGVGAGCTHRVHLV